MQPLFGIKFVNNIPKNMEYCGQNVRQAAQAMASRLDAVMPGDRVTIVATGYQEKTEAEVEQAKKIFDRDVANGWVKLGKGYSAEKPPYPFWFEFEVKTTQGVVGYEADDVGCLFAQPEYPTGQKMQDNFLRKLLPTLFKAFEAAHKK